MRSEPPGRSGLAHRSHRHRIGDAQRGISPGSYPWGMPKNPGSHRAEHRRKMHAMLFEAFSRLMETKGFDAINMATLAAEAGISRASVYYYFPDKEKLLLGYVEYEMGNYLDRLTRKLDEAQTPVEKLRIYVREQLGAKRGYLMSPGAPLRELISRETALALRQHVEATGNVLRRILAECVEAGAIPGQDLDVTVQLIHGALSGRRIPREEPERTAFFTATERFILRSVGA